MSRNREASVSVTADQRASLALSARLWWASHTHHGDVLAMPFIGALGARLLPWKAYADLLAQLFFLHESLAQAEDVMVPGPPRSTLTRSTTVCVPALAADLRFLYGPRWQQRITAYPATAAYCADLRDIAVREVRGFAAHHYARHVEDLLTGPDLAPAVSAAYGLDRAGRQFLDPGDVTARRYHDDRDDLLRGLPEPPPNQPGPVVATFRVHAMYLAVIKELDRSWT